MLRSITCPYCGKVLTCHLSERRAFLLKHFLEAHEAVYNAIERHKQICKEAQASIWRLYDGKEPL